MILSALSSYASRLNLTSCALFVLAIGFVCLTGLCFYRLFWHPFARYPGPWQAKLTTWYAAYHTYIGDWHLMIKHYHDQYGHAVRVSPNRLAFDTNTALNTIYRSRDVKKSVAYSGISAQDGTYHTFNMIDKKVHAKRNRMMRQAMNNDRLRTYEQAWRGDIDQLVECLVMDTDSTPETWSVAKDVGMHVDYMMIDIMGRMVFGRDFNTQTLPENRYMATVLKKLGLWNSIKLQSYSFASMHLDKLAYPLRVWYGYKVRDQIKSSLHQPSTQDKDDRETMFSTLLNAVDPVSGAKLTLAELWAEAKLLMFAGSDQPSSSIAITLFYLSRHPAVYTRLVRELTGAFPDPSEIYSGPQMDSCRYLDAVIKESFRMTPTSGAVPWREVDADSIVIDGFVVPRGCDVGASFYALHHNEDYFPDSYSFNPGRWLGEDEKTNSDLAQSAWCSFGIGERHCVAKTMSMLQIKNVLVTVLRRLDIRPPSDSTLARVGANPKLVRSGLYTEGEFQSRDHVTAQFEGPYLEFADDRPLCKGKRCVSVRGKNVAQLAPMSLSVYI